MASGGGSSKKRPPLGAKGEVMVKYLWPKHRVGKAFKHLVSTRGVSVLVTLTGMGTRRGSAGKELDAYLGTADEIRHADSGGGTGWGDLAEIYFARKFFKCHPLSAAQKREPPLLSTDVLVIGDEGASAAAVVVGGGAVADNEGGDTEGRALALEAALANDDLPLPDNTPSAADEQLEGAAAHPTAAKPVWGSATGQFPAVCRRAQEGFTGRAQLLAFDGDPSNPTPAELNLHFTPLNYWGLVADWSNQGCAGLGPPVHELRLFWSLRRVMSMCPGYSARQWFRSDLDTGVASLAGKAPFNLKPFMSRRRYEKVLSALRFSAPAATTTMQHKFVEEDVKEGHWNAHMARCYLPGPKIVVDESMCPWLGSRRSCPGWTMCPRKPRPFGRERHTAAGANRVIFAYELQQGGDRPIGGKRRFEALWGAGVVSLVLRLVERLFNTGRTVHLDSGFCVMLLIVALDMHGLFANAQVKKRKYWPKHPPIERIESHMEGTDVGHKGCIEGNFGGHKVHCIFLHDEQYNSIFMSNFAAPGARAGRLQRRCNGAVTFHYPENQAEYYACRPFVDHANENRHMTSGLGLEDSFDTKRIIVRDWTCDVAMSEANAYGVYVYMFGNKTSTLNFRKGIVRGELEALIEHFGFDQDDVDILLDGRAAVDLTGPAGQPGGASPAQPSPAAALGQAMTPSPATPESRRKRRRRHKLPTAVQGTVHLLRPLPAGCTNVVEADPDDPDGVRFKAVNPGKKGNKYPQYTCSYSGCKARIRTYCDCDDAVVGDAKVMFCSAHYAAHCAYLAVRLD